MPLSTIKDTVKKLLRGSSAMDTSSSTRDNTRADSTRGGGNTASSVPTDATDNTVSNEAAEASPKKSWRERDDAPDPFYDKEYRRELEGWCTAVGEWIEQLGIRNLGGDVGTTAEQLSTYMDMRADTHARGSRRRDWGPPIDFPSEMGMKALSDHLDKGQVDALGREWTEKRVQKTHNAIRELNLHAGRSDYYEDREKSTGTNTDMSSAN